jgi:hypothetical protein
VSSTAERLDGFLGSRARHRPHPEPAQHPVGIEDGGAVDLREGVSQRGEMKGPTDLQGWRSRKPLLVRRSWVGVGPVDEQCADAHRSEVVDGELEHRLEHVGMAVR